VRVVPDQTLELEAVHSDMRQVWSKIKELAEVSKETKDDFIPRVDLTRPDKPAARTAVIERTARPRIAPQVIKSPRETRRQYVAAQTVDWHSPETHY
jgi:hypothetical protein